MKTNKRKSKYEISFGERSGVSVTYYPKFKTITIGGWYDSIVISMSLQDFVEKLNIEDDVVELHSKKENMPAKKTKSNKKLEVDVCLYDDLTEDEKLDIPENRYASYLRVTHNGKTIRLESDAMEKEDAIFLRDLNWIQDAIMEAYELGLHDAAQRKDGHNESH